MMGTGAWSPAGLQLPVGLTKAEKEEACGEVEGEALHVCRLRPELQGALSVTMSSPREERAWVGVSW